MRRRRRRCRCCIRCWVVTVATATATSTDDDRRCARVSFGVEELDELEKLGELEQTVVVQVGQVEQEVVAQVGAYDGLAVLGDKGLDGVEDARVTNEVVAQAVGVPQAHDALLAVVDVAELVDHGARVVAQPLGVELVVRVALDLARQDGLRGRRVIVDALQARVAIEVAVRLHLVVVLLLLLLDEVERGHLVQRQVVELAQVDVVVASTFELKI